MSESSASPLLALLERFARTALASGAIGGSSVRLVGVETAPDGATLQVQVRGLGGLLDTTLRLRLTLREVGADTTRCTLSLPERGGLGRLLGAGLQNLPRPMLEQALAKLGPGVATLEGEELVLRHRELARRLRGLA